MTEAVAHRSCEGIHSESSSGSIPRWNLSSRSIFCENKVMTHFIPFIRYFTKLIVVWELVLTWKPWRAKLTSLGRLLSSAICSGSKQARRSSNEALRALLSWRQRISVTKIKLIYIVVWSVCTLLLRGSHPRSTVWSELSSSSIVQKKVDLILYYCQSSQSVSVSVFVSQCQALRPASCWSSLEAGCWSSIELRCDNSIWSSFFI